jgi:hypothetical protein
MADWSDVEAAAPEFAERAWARFAAYKHKYLATLRADGSPRISGIELNLVDGWLRLGMMPGSVKLADVQRDPRVAIHSGSPDPPDPERAAEWIGDAKVAGRLVELPLDQDAEPPGPRFRLDLTEVVATRIGDPPDHLEIESWHPADGYRSRKVY